MAKRVLITGGTGFAGKYISALLEVQGYEVFLTANVSEDIKGGKKNIFQLNLLDLNRVKAVVNEVTPNYVIHLAAISFVGHENIKDIYDVNIVGTKHLLIALNEMDEKPNAVVLTSSANIYGAREGVISEDCPYSPQNDYAVSKVAMEMMSRQFSNNLNLIIVRPFNFTGIGQNINFLVPKIVSHFIANKKEIELGNIEVERDFSDVRVVAQKFSALLKAPAAIGKTFNICSGTSTSLKRIINICEDVAGYKIKINVNPAFVRANEIKSQIGDTNYFDKAINGFNNTDMVSLIKWMLTSK